MPPDLALLSTLNGSNSPCLNLIFMVQKVYEPLKFYYIRWNVSGRIVFRIKEKSEADSYNYSKTPLLLTEMVTYWLFEDFENYKIYRRISNIPPNECMTSQIRNILMM